MRRIWRKIIEIAEIWLQRFRMEGGVKKHLTFADNQILIQGAAKEGVIKGAVCKRKRTQTNARKRTQMEISGSLNFKRGPTCRKMRASASERKQTRTKVKSKNYTRFCAPPFAAAQVIHVLRWAKTRVLKTDTRVSKRAF